MKLWKKLAAATALTVIAGGAMAEGLYAPNMAYRTGPFAALGIPLMNGQADYMTMLNERDGGVGGVPVDFSECETGYSTEKGVECYEKTKGTAIVTQPWSTGITLQVLPKTNVDALHCMRQLCLRQGPACRCCWLLRLLVNATQLT